MSYLSVLPSPGFRHLTLLEQIARQLEVSASGHTLLEPLIQIACAFQPHEEGIEAHLRRIASYVSLIGQAAGLTMPECLRLQASAVLHDVGMLIVPESVLRKTGPLASEDLELLHGHAEIGYAMLADRGVSVLDQASLVAWCHHERFDGTGYPRGLRGEDIPLAARITAIADVFDALTTQSAHKMAYPLDAALDMMEEGAGRLFDPELIAAFFIQEEALRELVVLDCCEAVQATGVLPQSFSVSARDRQEGNTFSALGRRFFACPFCPQLHPRTLWSCPETGRELSDIHRLSGAIINDKYLLQGILGTGGMAAVYEARNLLTERRVALKLLSTELADPVAHARFLIEARIFARVQHPNLVEVLDIERTPEGTLFLVMELLEGSDLEELLQEHGPLPEVRSAKITLELAKTLEAVHAAGIIHRDLKPANLFFTHSPRRLKLLDFGIALCHRSDGSRKQLTSENTFIGTPQYMSPEQAFHRSELDCRSDIFTVGSLLYEMLTGQCAFDGPNAMATMMRVIHGQYTPARELRPDLSDALLAILERTMALDPDERYPSASELARDLGAFLNTRVAT